MEVYLPDGSVVKIKYQRENGFGQGVGHRQQILECLLPNKVIKSPKMKGEYLRQRDKGNGEVRHSLCGEPWLLPLLSLCSECPVVGEKGHLAELCWECLLSTLPIQMPCGTV